jgi:hypothetical protein
VRAVKAQRRQCRVTEVQVLAESPFDADPTVCTGLVRANGPHDVPVQVMLPQPGQILAHHDVVVEQYDPPELREELLKANASGVTTQFLS